LLLYRLVSECRPLDLNSKYAYFLIASHFSETSVIAFDGDIPAAMTSAYIKPEEKDTLFIWQIAVLQKYRGKKLALKMLNEILSRPALRNIQYIETTVTETNAASEKVFLNLAEKLKCPVGKTEFINSKDFTDEKDSSFHETEFLYKIGPLNGSILIE